MNHRDPLTCRYARTIRETRHDFYDWWASAEAEAANEKHMRSVFAEPARPRRQSRSHFWADVTVCLIAGGVFFAFFKGWL